MSSRRTLAIDAMGGDHAPGMIVEGVSQASEYLSDVRFLLFGNETLIRPLLDKYPKARAVSEIRHTDKVVRNEDKVAVALRAGRSSSMRLAINAVGDGEADGIVSAGNTGALMAMAKIVLKTLPGISRPAIATHFPTERGTSVMLDLGANVVCSADDLVQFAIMGEVFSRHVLKLDQPSVAILNVGVEDLKGHEEVKHAAAMLKNTKLPIRFHGFVEGDGIAAGLVDVIVTDGFTGNVALKTSEGMAGMFKKHLMGNLTSSLTGRLGAWIARSALNRFKQKFDPRQYNGAMFVGLNGICVKSHGGTDGLGFAHACRVAMDLIDGGFNDRIKEDLAVFLATKAAETRTEGKATTH